MAPRTHKTAATRGPAIFDNWQASKTHDATSAMEFPLFTEAHFTGDDVAYGPYTFINAVAISQRDVLRPSLVVRVRQHVDLTQAQREQLEIGKTDDKLYHGGGIADELAALVSLCCGARVQAGPVSRLFSQGDVSGRPIAWHWERQPVLPPSHVMYRSAIPRLAVDRSMEQLSPLERLLHLKAKDAVVFVRAARLYQDGLWLVESEPHLSWLLFVAAIETVSQHVRSSKSSPLEQLRDWKVGREIEAILSEAGAQACINAIASRLAPLTSSQRKFVSFLDRFCPEPPATRPSLGFQFDWSRESRQEMFKRVYECRSNALHDGRRFPAPMLYPGFPDPTTGVVSEVPLGIATAIDGGIWSREDTPILLHVFEHIVRGALLNWFRATAVVAESVSASTD